MGLLIDAGTEYVSIAYNAKWTFTPVSYTRTIALWWKTTSLPNAANEYQVFFSASQDGGNKYQCGIIHNGSANLLFGWIRNASWSAIGYFTCALPTVVSGTWYHIVFVFGSGATCKIYWNGAAQTVTPLSWDDAETIDPTSITLGDGAGVYDTMTLAHFAVFSDELTSAEVAAHRTNPWAAPADPNCICFMPLDEGQGVTARDRSATATDGTLTNSPTWVANPPLRHPVRARGIPARSFIRR